jgi:hypothetical protein
MSRRFRKAQHYFAFGNVLASRARLPKLGFLARFADVTQRTSAVRAARGAARVA